MKQKRRRYSGALKAKVGLEAVMGIKTTSQIAREHQVHPLLVTQWKRILLDRCNVARCFVEGEAS